MKKVLIFSLNYFPRYVGGAEVAIKEIVERLVNPLARPGDKYNFHMLTLRFDSNLPKEETIHGIKIYRIGFTKKNATIADLKKFPLFLNKYYFQVFAFLYAWKLHKKENFDIVWAMMAHSCGVPAGIFKFFFPKVKYVLTLQEGDPPEYIENLARPFPKFLFFLNNISFAFFKNAFTRADVVQSISTFLNNWAKKMGNKNFCVVVPNAVNFKKFSAEFSVEDVKSVQKKFGKKQDETWLITTSRLVHKNAIDNCIQAVKLLNDKNLNIHFAIVGIGPDEGKLKALANSLQIENKIHFIGEVQNENLPIYLRACEIFVRPSRSEGMGISFLEAMSARLPVVATREGGISDFLFDGITGWVCEKDNPESIVQAVEKIFESKQNGEFEKVLDNASKMVEEKYNWDTIASRMDQEVFSHAGI